MTDLGRWLLNLGLPEYEGVFADNKSGAEAAFQQAVGIARGRGAKVLELRAATRLGHLWFDDNKREHARDLPEPIYGGFSEGHDTPDLKDAQELLDAAQ